MKTFQKRLYSIAILVALPGLALHAQMGGPMMDGEGDRSGISMDRGRMHERMQDMEQELQEQLQAMQEAEGDARIDAMAETIRTLANQRQQMLQQRQRMMQKMMGHMGQHMAMKGSDGEKGEMMMSCPMMRMMDSESGDHHHSRRSS